MKRVWEGGLYSILLLDRDTVGGKPEQSKGWSLARLPSHPERLAFHVETRGFCSQSMRISCRLRGVPASETVYVSHTLFVACCT